MLPLKNDSSIFIEFRAFIILSLKTVIMNSIISHQNHVDNKAFAINSSSDDLSITPFAHFTHFIWFTRVIH